MSVRAHLENVERQTGKRPDGLNGPECPDLLKYLLQWFLDISVFRRNGMAGPERITPLDIAGYSLVTGQWPEPWEFRTLGLLDQAFIENHHRKPAPKPVQNDGKPKPKTRRG